MVTSLYFRADRGREVLWSQVCISVQIGEEKYYGHKFSFPCTDRGREVLWSQVCACQVQRGVPHDALQPELDTAGHLFPGGPRWPQPFRPSRDWFRGDGGMPEVLRHFSQVPVHGRSEHQRGVCRGNTVPGRQVQRHIAQKSLHSVHGGTHEVRVTSLTFKSFFVVFLPYIIQWLASTPGRPTCHVIEEVFLYVIFGALIAITSLAVSVAFLCCMR